MRRYLNMIVMSCAVILIILKALILLTSCCFLFRDVDSIEFSGPALDSGLTTSTIVLIFFRGRWAELEGGSFEVKSWSTACRFGALRPYLIIVDWGIRWYTRCKLEDA